MNREQRRAAKQSTSAARWFGSIDQRALAFSPRSLPVRVSTKRPMVKPGSSRMRSDASLKSSATDGGTHTLHCTKPASIIRSRSRACLSALLMPMGPFPPNVITKAPLLMTVLAAVNIRMKGGRNGKSLSGS